MFKLCFYVPDEALEAVKSAVFAAGAGGQGRYAECAWQVRGEGQFRPLDGADPASGAVGELCRMPEWKVEMIVPDGAARAAVAALRRAHPYEEVAFSLTALHSLD